MRLIPTLGLSILTGGDFALRGHVATSGDSLGRRAWGLPLVSGEQRSGMLRTSFSIIVAMSFAVYSDPTQ